MMMRRILTFAAALAAVLTVEAQREVGMVTVCPRLGLNWSKLSGSDIYYELEDGAAPASAGYKTGFTAGVEALYQFAPSTAFSAGVLYSCQGAEWDFPGMDYKVNLHYVTVPLMAVQYLGTSGVALKAGVQVGWLADAGDKYSELSENPGISEDKGASADVKSAYKTFDFSIPVGISYEYRNIVLDLRYNIGVTKVFKHVDGGSNRSVMLTLGYGFDI